MTEHKGDKRSTLWPRLALLAGAAALLGVAWVVGISDNLPGILLVFLSSIAIVLAYAVAFRTPRQYELLLLYSVVGFVGAAILHNVFEAASSVAGAAWLKAVGEGIGVAFFLLAIFLCPAGFVVGLAGCIVKRLRGRGLVVTQ